MRSLDQEGAGVTTSRVAGLARVVLAGVLLPVLVWALPGTGPSAFFALGLALAYGTLLAAGRPRVLAHEPLAPVALDALTVCLLVAGTGGEGSPLFALYLPAALGVARVSGPARAAAAVAAMSGGYLVAAGLAGGPEALSVVPVVLGAGFVALACVGAAYLGLEIRNLAGRGLALSTALAAARDRTARAEDLVSGFGAVLGASGVEGILSWTIRTANTGCGGTYAHVSVLGENHHVSLFEGDGDACPSWWHPLIQGLVLRACREGAAVRSGEEIHGIRGFLAVPLGPADDGRGAVVVGGGEFGADEERVLGLISAAAGPALEAAEESPAGRDPVSGLPNRASLHRVLRRELSQGRALTVLAVGLDGLGRYNRAHGFAAGDALLRRVGERLGGGRRAFHYGGDEFVVVAGGTDEARARRAALAIGRVISEEAGDLIRPAVVFVHAGPGQEDPEPVIGSALLALREARADAEGVAGLRALAAETAEFGGRPAGIVDALVGALEAKDPGITEHLRSVCRISRDIARRMSLPEEQAEGLVAGALLHDVGKIGVPDQILRKPGPLTEEEYDVIKRHPALGAEIVAPVGGLAQALPAVRHHHERFDGNGYPDGLRGEEIPLQARIVAVADAFDSMIRSRPYGYGVPRGVALAEIEANAETQFDPSIVEALRAILEGPDDRRAGSTA